MSGLRRATAWHTGSGRPARSRRRSRSSATPDASARRGSAPIAAWPATRMARQPASADRRVRAARVGHGFQRLRRDQRAHAQPMFAQQRPGAPRFARRPGQRHAAIGRARPWPMARSSMSPRIMGSSTLHGGGLARLGQGGDLQRGRDHVLGVQHRLAGRLRIGLAERAQLALRATAAPVEPGIGQRRVRVQRRQGEGRCVRCSSIVFSHPDGRGRGAGRGAQRACAVRRARSTTTPRAMNQPLAVTTAGGVPEAGARQAVGEVAAVVEGVARSRSPAMARPGRSTGRAPARR